jgi:type VI secretion system protein ImpL
LRLDVIAGVVIEKVLRRRSGARLSEPVPPVYTKKVFNELTGGEMLPIVKRFSDDAWVWGTGTLAVGNWDTLTAQVTDVYERDYNQYWENLLADLEFVRFSNVQQYVDALTILASPTSSPLRGILKTTVDNTTLVTSAEGAAAGPAPGIVDRLREGGRNIINKGRTTLFGGVVPGTLVTQRFTPIHRIMAGSPAPFDGIIEQIRKLRDQLQKLGPQVGGQSPLEAMKDPSVRDLANTLQTDAGNLPPPVDGLIKTLVGETTRAFNEAGATELSRKYQSEIVPRCQQLVNDHYPFGNGTEMPLVTFGEVFGYGGLYDKFFAERVENLTDRTQSNLVWRPGMGAASPAMLAQFERVERIRQMFFNPGSKTPELNFSIRLSGVDPSATRFYVNIDGQQFEARPGSDSRTPMQWPGTDKRGIGIAVFDDRITAPDRVANIGGPWALFRLVDAHIARAGTAADSDLETVLRIETKFHKALVAIEASSGTTNPFASTGWRQFRCES